MIKLYSYFRSSGSYRVRIALNLKEVDYTTEPIHLVKDGGEQFTTQFTSKNAAARVPVIETDGFTLAQSLPICEYLEETHPTPKLLPENPKDKALVRQLCEIVNSDIQPLQNLSVLKKLVGELGISDDQKLDWIRYWITRGFESFESLLETTSGDFCFGNSLSFADCFLIPQVYNAERFNVDMSQFPKIKTINDRCVGMEAFLKAHPDNQPDTPS